MTKTNSKELPEVIFLHPPLPPLQCHTDKFMIEGWVERRQRTGLLVLKTSEASAIFKQTAKYLHEYTVSFGAGSSLK